MKRIYISISTVIRSAITIMLTVLLTGAFISCSDDDPVTNITEEENSEYGTVRFRFSIPVSINKAEDNSPADAPTMFGHGLDASSFNYAVYRKGADGSYTLVDPEEYLYEGEAPVAERDTKNPLNYQMVMTMKKGVYTLVFWLDSNLEQGGRKLYTFDVENHRVVVDYELMNTLSPNSEMQDAFFGKADDVPFSTYTSKSVTLRRPFAQINIGQDGMEYRQSTSAPTVDFEVSDIYTSLDLITGIASDKVTSPVKFSGWNVVPKGTQSFLVEDKEAENYSGLQYLTMYYVLTGSNLDSDWTGDEPEHHSLPETVSGKLTVNGVGTVNLDNIEIARNYRTNIYGRYRNNDIVNRRSEKYFDQEVLMRSIDIDVSIMYNTAGQLTANLEKAGALLNNDGRYTFTTLYLGGEMNDDDWKVFLKCAYLKNLYLGSVKAAKIPQYTLINCNRLETLILPETLTYLDQLFNVRSDCDGTDVTSPFTKTKGLAPQIDPVNKIKNITLPNSLTEVRWGAFQAWASLERLDLSKVTKINFLDIFWGCSSLEEIKFAPGLCENMTILSTAAFTHCKSLKSVPAFPKITTVYAHTFEGTSINPNDVLKGSPLIKDIRDNAFADIQISIDELKIPVTVEKLGVNCFGNLKVKTIYLDNAQKTPTLDSGLYAIWHQGTMTGWSTFPAFYNAHTELKALVYANNTAHAISSKDGNYRCPFWGMQHVDAGLPTRFNSDCYLYVDDNQVDEWKLDKYGWNGLMQGRIRSISDLPD